MSVVICISQIKGGSGKTTIAINLAGTLKNLGYKVLVADMDKDKPDALRWAKQGKSIDFVQEVFDEKPSDKIEVMKYQYDFIVLDTPSNYTLTTFKAIMMSDLIILPCSPSLLDKNNLMESLSIPQGSNKLFRVLGTKVKAYEVASERLLKDLAKSPFSFNTKISFALDLIDCTFEGQWVGQYDESSLSFQEFNQLAQEIIDFFGNSLKI